MRTSAHNAENGFTGSRRSAENGFVSLKRSAENGFTLIELLIVLAIIGLLTAVVVVAMPDPRGSLTHEAERFAAKVQAVRDMAIVDGRTMRVTIDNKGYYFSQKNAGSWQPLSQKSLQKTLWSQGALPTRNTPASIRFDSTGIVTNPANIVLGRDTEHATIIIAQDGKTRVAR